MQCNCVGSEVHLLMADEKVADDSARPSEVFVGGPQATARPWPTESADPLILASLEAPHTPQNPRTQAAVTIP
jgi:hypothetical protein